MSLLELVVVLALLAAVTAMVTPLLGDVAEQARRTATRRTLVELQRVIANRYRLDMKGVIVGDVADPFVVAGLPGPAPHLLIPGDRSRHPQLVFLFINPLTYNDAATYDHRTARGWLGPYLLRGAAGTYPGGHPGAAGRGFGKLYGEPGDPTVLDGWANPIVLVTDAAVPQLIRLESAGADGDLGTAEDNLFVTFSLDDQ